MIAAKEQTKIKSFTDLRTWQAGHRLVLEIYRMTREFPPEEQFGLSSQLKRAAVSFTSNIAEGFSRYSYKDKTKFYFMSLGSLTEIQNQLLIARDIGYIPKNIFDQFANETIEINKMVSSLIKKSQSYIRDSKF